MFNTYNLLENTIEELKKALLIKQFELKTLPQEKRFYYDRLILIGQIKDLKKSIEKKEKNPRN